MANKRKLPHMYASERDQSQNGGPKRPRTQDNGPKKSFKKAHPVNELKSQIRSLGRLLEKSESLPANIRVEKERAQRTAQYELQETYRAKKRSQMISRYHKVRFFDRQKAVKRLKRAKKELDACDGSDSKRTDLEDNVRNAEVDVNYAKYYPLHLPYPALFPTRKPAEKDDAEKEDAGEMQDRVERQGDHDMWEKVKQCMEDGTLEALREGKIATQDEDKTSPAVVEKTQRSPYSAKKGSGDKNAEKATRNFGNESDAESDGGFFE